MCLEIFLVNYRPFLFRNGFNVSIRLFHVKIANVTYFDEKWIIMQIYHIKSSLGNCMGCTEISMYYIKSCCKFMINNPTILSSPKDPQTAPENYVLLYVKSEYS